MVGEYHVRSGMLMDRSLVDRVALDSAYRGGVLASRSPLLLLGASGGFLGCGFLLPRD